MLFLWLAGILWRQKPIFFAVFIIIHHQFSDYDLRNNLEGTTNHRPRQMSSYFTSLPAGYSGAEQNGQETAENPVDFSQANVHYGQGGGFMPVSNSVGYNYGTTAMTMGMNPSPTTDYYNPQRLSHGAMGQTQGSPGLESPRMTQVGGMTGTSSPNYTSNYPRSYPDQSSQLSQNGVPGATPTQQGLPTSQNYPQPQIYPWMRKMHFGHGKKGKINI